MFQPIHSWASIRVSGTDRFEFLQGQLTQDLDKIRDGQPMLAGWANAKGRLLCIAWVLEWRDAVYLILPADLTDSVARRLGDVCAQITGGNQPAGYSGLVPEQ